MNWNRWYRLISYARSSLWIVPFVAILLDQIVIRAVSRIDAWLGWSFYGIGVHGAETALQTVITLTLSFIVFTFGSLLVAIQVASGQLTPRIIATTLLRNNVVRCSVGLFVFSLLFAAGALTRAETEVPELTLAVAVVLGFVSIAAFLYLIDYAARLLRPISIVARVSEEGIQVIEHVYPDNVRAGTGAASPAPPPLNAPSRTVCHQGRSEIVLAVNVGILVAEAQRLDGIIEFVPQVGDFVAVGEPVYRLYGGAAAADERRLRQAAVFGVERTIEQDPTFAFRVIVDIAIKALSKAINDPTTAVVSIDQLHRLLRLVGKRDLRNENISDRDGRLRVVLRTPGWDDFVQLAYSEIRQYGAESFQIARRLRAMTENLIQTLPEHRHAALRQELSLLDRTLEKLHVFPEDLALARVADSQGLGGASRAKP